jgi:O-antigen/teichoic acid export membrane protein
LPVFLSAAWLAPEWLPFLIGSQWNGAMAPLQALLLAGLLQAFLHFNHAVFRAVGRPQRSWQLGLASLALNGLLVTVAVRWGVQAVAWAYLLRVALIGPWGAVLACRELGIGARTFWRTSGAPVLVGAAAVVVTLGFGWLLKPVALMSGAGADALKALLAWLPAIALYGFWLLRHSPALSDLRRRPAADGSRSRKWAPGASRASRPA